MKTHFKSIKEARESLKEQFAGNEPLNRESTAKALKISTATLHRLRNSGAITATVTEFNGMSMITYKRAEVSLLMFKRGV